MSTGRRAAVARLAILAILAWLPPPAATSLAAIGGASSSGTGAGSAPAAADRPVGSTGGAVTERSGQEGAPSAPVVGRGTAVTPTSGWRGSLVRGLAGLQHWQRRLNETLARQLRLVRRGEPGAVATVLLAALAYGVLHALGPGHGKAVVASLFLGSQARLGRGIAIGFLVSFLQILSSIAVVSVLGLVLGHGSFAVARETVWVEIVSYGLVATFGVWMTVRALAGASHEHGAARSAPPPSREESSDSAPVGGARRQAATRGKAGLAVPGLILAAGLTPCPSGIIVLLFALANQVLVVGLEACLVMAIGMGATVSAIGVATILVRQTALAPLRARPRALSWASRALAIGGSITLTVVGGLLLAGAWTRLP